MLDLILSHIITETPEMSAQTCWRDTPLRHWTLAHWDDAVNTNHFIIIKWHH